MSENIFTPGEIARILNAKSKIEQKVKTFFDENLQNPNCYFVSGGCIASLLRDEEPNDYDVYFFTKSIGDWMILAFTNEEKYWVQEVEEKYRDVFGVDGLCITENAITLKNKIQLITKHYGQPDEVRKTFDFVHCTPYYDSRDGKLYISKKQYDACVNKVLINNMPAHAPSRHRFEKFRERNYTV